MGLSSKFSSNPNLHGVALKRKGLCGYIQRPVHPAVLRVGPSAADLLWGAPWCALSDIEVSTPPQTLRAAVRSLSGLGCAA